MKITREFLQSPEMQGLNRESCHATMFHFASEVQARSYYRENSPFTTLLNGKWRFAYTEDPIAIDEACYAESFDDSAWEEISVPDCWVMRDNVPDKPHYTNIDMPFNANPPEVPEKNPTGIYRRELVLDQVNLSKRYILHFDGAESVI